MNRPATSNADIAIRDFMTRTPKQKLEGFPVILAGSAICLWRIFLRIHSGRLDLDA